MWHEIISDADVTAFMKKVSFFHDSCIKELRYSSGAYVDQNFSMYPVNDRRTLNVVIQRQFKDTPVIELEFNGLKYLKLFPINDQYTCEILDSTMILTHNYIYWCDCGKISVSDLENYSGTLICAEKVRWRSIDECIGNRDYFTSIVQRE